MRAAIAFALLAFATPDFQISGDAREFAPDIISTKYSDVRLTISPDGNTALWFSRNRPGGPGSYDIWMSRRASGGWHDATPVSFNSPSRDFDPGFSRDGRFVYFSSDRPGGAGRMDLFTAIDRRGRFETIKPLPGLLNTPADEFDATFLRDGVSIIFTRADDLTKDPVALYYGARIDGLYTRGNRLIDEINTPKSDTYAPMLDWSDPNYITFTTRRPADSLRGADLYRVEARVR